jgi:glycosyltransferase involved in cell wall biosynthesis
MHRRRPATDAVETAAQGRGSALRVLWVEHTGELGGGQLNLHRYIRRCTAVDNELLVLGEGPLADAAAETGTPCTDIPFDYRRPSTYANIVAVRRHVRSSDYDLVVSNSIKSAMIVGLTGGRRIRHVAYLHQGMDWFSPPRRAVYNLTAGRSVVAYLSASDWTAGTRSGKARARPVSIVHSLSGIDDGPTGSMRDWNEKPLQVLSLSRFIPEKGIHTVVKAARLCQELGYGESIHFSLVGEGVMGSDSYARDVRTEAERDGSNVTFHGYSRDIAGYLESHHVMVHASSIPEAFGQVLMQGLAAGLVVVSTGYGGAAELFQDGYSGIKFDKDDAETLARILIGLHENRDRCAVLARRGQGTAAAFTDEVVTQRIDEALAGFASL